MQKSPEGHLPMTASDQPGQIEGELQVASKKVNRKFNPFECCMYLVFLILFTVLVVQGAGPNGDASYYCSEGIREPLLTKEFDDGRYLSHIRGITDVWNWLDVVLLPTLVKSGGTRECVWGDPEDGKGVGCSPAHSSTFDTLQKRENGQASKSCVPDDSILAGQGGIAGGEIDRGGQVVQAAQVAWVDPQPSDPLTDDVLPSRLRVTYQGNTREAIEIKDNGAKIVLMYEPIGCPGADGELLDPQDRNMVQLNNRLLGGIRLKMQRVKTEECLYNKLRCPTDGTKCTEGVFTECYPEYSASKENKEPLEGYRSDIIMFDNALQLYDNKDHTWMSVNERDQESAGKILYTERADTRDQLLYISRVKSYSGGGYVVQLPGDYVTARKVLLELRRRSFLDRSTRSLMVDWNTYNANVNLHTTGRIAFEFPSSGSVNVEIEVKTWNLLRYEGPTGTVVRVLEYMYFLFVLFFTAWEFYEIFEDGKRMGKMSRAICVHFSSKQGGSGWHYLDIVNLVVYYVTIVQHFYIDTSHQDVVDNGGFINIDNYVSYRQLTSHHVIFNYVVAINGFLLWIKVFKYLNFMPRLSWFFRLMASAGPEILFFFVCLIIIIFAFAMVGSLLFSSDMNDFRNVQYSFANLFRFSLTSDMSYDAIVGSNRMMGTAFYLLFNCIMYIIILNVLIAILSESYIGVKTKIDQKASETNAITFNSLLRRIFRVDMKEADTNKDGYLDKTELQNKLNVQGSGVDANVVMDEFDQDGDGRLDERELSMMNRSMSNRGRSPEQKRIMKS